MTHYNPWPLGKLPEKWQRQEPYLIRQLGYSWDDPRDIIKLFEEKLASYSGAKYCVLTDCCSHAIFLSLKYVNSPCQISIPAHTYASVPMQIVHAGYQINFIDLKWKGMYQLHPINVFDGAGRFRKDMYVGGDALQTLSFQIKKRLPIGRGGAILTNSKEAYDWLKLASYDGRNLETPYAEPNHITNIGWHYYMTPEDAARGIILMDQITGELEDTMTWLNYPDLRHYKFRFDS